MTASASSLRSRPLSTKMHESCGPIAWYKQRRDDGRIDAAGQAADHAVVADALADLRDRLLGEIAQLPRAGAAADVRAGSWRASFCRRACASPRDETAGRRSAASRASPRRCGQVSVLGQRHEVVRDAYRPGRRGSSRLRSRAARRRTESASSPSLIVQWARPILADRRGSALGRRAPGT